MTGASRWTQHRQTGHPACALNRKNALFAGSDAGGQHWAVLASLIETCKLNAVEPHAYLAEMLTQLVNGHPNSRIDDLPPWAHVAREQRYLQGPR